jgi:catechol 2,3-dioxygenase-like lactoylglutathione lyase family enzyme
MAHEDSSLLPHVSISTDDFTRAVEFYSKVLATLGCKRIMEHPGAVAFGKGLPEFWVQTPIDGKRASVGNGVHFGFVAESKGAVHAFYEVALQAGAKDDGAPGPRPDYGEPYYGCFARS